MLLFVEEVNVDKRKVIMLGGKEGLDVIGACVIRSWLMLGVISFSEIRSCMRHCVCLFECMVVR